MKRDFEHACATRRQRSLERLQSFYDAGERERED
jgi:hypothetical protein